MLRQLTRRKNLLSFVLGAAVAFGSAVSAHADTLTFDFNSIALSSGMWTNNDANAISNYMTSVWSGVTISGAAATQKYNGDGHVVGNIYCSGSHCTVYSNTIGTSDGATGLLNGQRTPGQTDPPYYDTFLVNITSLNDTSANPATDRITITFPSKIYSLSFDYEIFPDGSCPNPGSTKSTKNLGCTKQSSPNWPDFELIADNTSMLSTFADVPACSSPDWHSPNSGTHSCETAPQYIGTDSVSFPGGVTTLEFVDWPAMIGIDNLVINYDDPPRQTPPNSVPEPSSMLLLGAGLIGLRSLMSRRGRKEEE